MRRRKEECLTLLDYIVCVCLKDPVEHRQAALPPPPGRLVLMTPALRLLQGMGDSLHYISNIISRRRRGRSEEWNGEKYAVKGDGLVVNIEFNKTAMGSGRGNHTK